MILTVWPGSPALTPLPSRDAAVFLYLGDQVRQGRLLYRDAWDHKPPVVHLINAAGLSLANGSRWGVWLIWAIGQRVAPGLAGRPSAPRQSPEPR